MSLAAFDDLRVLSGPAAEAASGPAAEAASGPAAEAASGPAAEAASGTAAAPGPTLCTLVRNEMYYLPAFLAHYRRLGAGRFIVLDDRSEDGSRAFLAAQPDVTLLESGRRFGDIVTAAAGPTAGLPQMMDKVWRSLMMRRFCTGRWAFCLDVDEFLMLPDGLTLPGLVALAASGPARAVTSVMLDMYPADIAGMDSTAPFDPDDPGWFFDAVPHVAHDPAAPDGLRLIHPGSRARLMRHFGVDRVPPLRRLATVLGLRPPRPFNMITKTVLMRWQQDDAFLSAHVATAAPDPRILLPLRHYKFTPDTWRRTAEAIEGKQHYRGSQEYTAMETLLMRMRAGGGSFLGPASRPGHRAAAYVESGNLILPG